MTSKTLLRSSVLGLALFSIAAPDSAAQSRVMVPGGESPKSIAPAGKSEAGASSAIGLSKEQNKLFLELMDVRKKKTAEMHKIEDRATKYENGAEIGKWWRTMIQEMMTDEQYSRYGEYWETNNVVIGFDAKNKGAYTVTIAPHPLDASTKILESLKLTDPQLRKINALSANIAKEMKRANELAKSPEGLPNVDAIIARTQRERNETLKDVLSQTQYADYRKMIDKVIESAVSARKSAAPRMAAPVKP